MSITRYDPFRDLRTLQEEVNRLFTGNAARTFDDEGIARGSWNPNVDIYENKDQIVLEAELPGMKREDFELSVENSKVKETTEQYTKALSGILHNKSDVIGYVFAINGHVNSADVYASHALFVKLWPKLLNASAVEAVAELNKEVEPKAVASETVHTFLADSEKARAEARQVTRRVKVVTREDDKNIFFETQDSAANDGWVHRNYIRKQ